MSETTNSKVSEIISLIMLFFILLIGALGAYITAQLNWGVSLLYLFMTLSMLAIVVVCGIVALVRNVRFRFKWLILINAVLFAISINLTYSETGIYEWHKYRFLFQTHSGPTPAWMESLATFSLFSSALLSLLGCSLMIAWAFAPKNMN